MEGGKIDFDRLKLTSGADVDAGKERYGLGGQGKRDVRVTLVEVIAVRG